MSDANIDEAKTVELQVDDVVDGRYRINRRLGRGGMGTVYESQQIKLQRQVALKVLRPEFATKELAAKRFEREARAASSIDHRNVVKILDFGHLATGELYYTMELLHGRDLSQVLREAVALPWSRAGWIILQVVRAFAAIHDKGIVHRDIKPANCFLLDPKPGDDPDFVKILDFGIANLQDQDKATALTAASDIIGSVRYMAPEQAAADHVDARTDIYSLGIMMYELLTGQVPFRESNVFKVMIQHQHEVPRPPRELVPEIPPEVEAIILRCIAKHPDARFQSMGEVEAALLPLVELVPGSGVLQRTGEPSMSASSRSAANTSPGPTGTVAISAGGSLGSMGTLGRGADTTPRVGGSMALSELQPPPGRRGRPIVPIVVALLVFAVAIGVTVWLKQSGTGDEVVKSDVAKDEAPTKVEAKEEPIEAEPAPLQLAPPPEQQYDPFADPFGAPPLRGRTAPRMVTGAAGEAEAGAPARVVPLEELLPPEPWTLEPGSIAGRMLGEKERPLAKGRVCAWLVDPRAPIELRRRPKCTEADRQGRFELRGVVPGFYDLNAFARGFLPQSSLARDGYPLMVQPGQRSEGGELLLVPGGVEVRGTVTTTAGEPLELASVAVVGAVRALAVTDAAGAFSLWVAEGEVAVVAWANGYTDVVARGPASAPLRLVLRREAILLGKVVDADTGEPLENARVRAGAKSGVDPLVYTDAKGEFRIPALSEGLYEPSARTDEAYGKAGKAVKILEGTISAEVVIQAQRQVVAKPPEPAVVVEAAEDSGGTSESDGGSSGGDTEETGGSGGDTAPVVASDEPDAPVAPATGEPATPAARPSGPTNASLRKALEGKLRRCLTRSGKDGKIELTADFVLDTGKLLHPKVEVSGDAGKDPAVKACAEKELKGWKLLPRDEASSFKPLAVKP